MVQLREEWLRKREKQNEQDMKDGGITLKAKNI